MWREIVCFTVLRVLLKWKGYYHMELYTRKLVSVAKARSFHQSIGLFNSKQSLDRVVLSLIDTLV